MVRYSPYSAKIPSRNQRYAGKSIADIQRIYDVKIVIRLNQPEHRKRIAFIRIFISEDKIVVINAVVKSRNNRR